MEDIKMARRKSILDLYKMKEQGEKLSWITAYDFPMASFAEQAGMDMILVGDSLGMVVMGYNGTVPVTMEDCISHCKSVRRGAPNTMIVGDMPFGSYQTSDVDAVKNAVRFLKEADMDCIKLEGGVRIASRIRAITDAGIVVCGHIGLTPQSSGALGGFKAQGRKIPGAKAMIEDALAVQEAGARMILLEAMPPELTAFITELLDIPVYSIGAGEPCDGQLIICGDMLGMFQAFTPKFVKKYANVAEVMTNAMKEYVADVKSSKFPEDKHVYHAQDSIEDFEKLFDEYR
jgi:3-methyl-2-oxobutanoate hydroxymethyltransferase